MWIVKKQKMSNVYTRKNLLPRSLTQADYNRNNGTSNFAYKQLPEIKKEDESKLINVSYVFFKLLKLFQ